jgi:hypothetical protein
MKTSLRTLGWLRDLVLILLVFAGNHTRQTSPVVGYIIMASAAVIFVERFLWSWHILDLADNRE